MNAERIVEVEWEDCAVRHRWQDMASRFPNALRAHSLGYVLQDDEKGIVLTESLDEDDAVEDQLRGCTTIIPRSAIHKVIELKRET